MNAIHRYALFAAIAAASGAIANVFADSIRVSFATRTQSADGKVREHPIMLVDNGVMRVEFARNTYWTIREIIFKDNIVGRPSGGTGSVVTWDGVPVGTVHRSGEKHEYLDSVDMILDGEKTVSLYSSGKEIFSDKETYICNKFELRKKSAIGPFRHQTHFTFRSGSNVLIAVNDFEAKEDIPAERFRGYRYVFMHMMPVDMSEWMRLNPDASVTTGTIRGNERTKPITLWSEPARGLATYDPGKQIGIAYSYPAGFAGVSEYTFRPGKDIKFRARLFDQDSYVAGDKRQWRLILEPFDATPADWIKIATGMINKGEKP